MKINLVKSIVFTAIMAASCLWFAGCASAPRQNQDALQPQQNPPQKKQRRDSMTKERILMQADVKGKPPVVFARNLEDVRQAALRALTFVGCKVNRQESLFLSGSRPHKFGLLVGSGGERVDVYLYPESDTETHVWVRTHVSFVGMAGQKGWSGQVLEQMTQLLNNPPSAQ